MMVDCLRDLILHGTRHFFVTFWEVDVARCSSPAHMNSRLWFVTNDLVGHSALVEMLVPILHIIQRQPLESN